MPLAQSFQDLADQGFGRGSNIPGPFTGVRFGTVAEDITGSEPVFAEHVKRLYRLLSGAQENAEVGVNGLLAVQRLRVNEVLDAFELSLTDLTVTGDTVLTDVAVQGALSIDGGSIGAGFAGALSGVTASTGDIGTSSPTGDELEYGIRDNAVTYDAVGASGADGLLLADGGALSWSPLLISGELSGDGINVALGIADRSVGLAELETGQAQSVRVNDATGAPAEVSVDENAVLTGAASGFSGLTVAEDAAVGRIGSSVLTSVPYTTIKDRMGITPSDVSTTGSTSDNVFSGAGDFRFTENVRIFGDPAALRLISSDPPNNGTTVSEITLGANNASGEASIIQETTRASSGSIIGQRLTIESERNMIIRSKQGGAMGMYTDGNIILENDGTLRLRSLSGFLTMEGDQTSLRADDGDLTLSSFNGDIRLNTSTGDFVFFGGSTFNSADVAVDPSTGAVLFRAGDINRVSGGGIFSSVPDGWAALYAYEDGSSDVDMAVYEFATDNYNTFA